MAETPAENLVERVYARRVGNNEYVVVVQRWMRAPDEERLLRGPVSRYEAQGLVKVENAKRENFGFRDSGL